MADDMEGKTDVILDVALAAQRQRDMLLEAFRSRAGWTLASASIAGAILAPDTSEGGALVIAALITFGLMTAATVSAYWPRRWRDTPNVHELVTHYLDAPDAAGLSLAALKRDVALKRYDLFEEHAAPLRRVRWSMNASMILLGVFVMLLLLDRTM